MLSKRGHVNVLRVHNRSERKRQGLHIYNFGRLACDKSRYYENDAQQTK